MADLPQAVKAEAEDAAKTAVAEFIGDGLSEDEALDLLAGILDAALPLRALLPGLAGELAEMQDGPLIRKALGELEDACRRDPDRMERRAKAAEENGKPEKAARIRKRRERVIARQS